MSANTPLPNFDYHPDPIATGSIKASEVACKACGKARGFIYTGPVYSSLSPDPDIDDQLCPWCIADGTAHTRFDASFTDEESIGRISGWEEVPLKVIEQVAYRTPGFSGWQQERWFTHHGDAAALIAIVGRKELEELGPEAVAVIRKECNYGDQEWSAYYAALDKDDGPTAYIFRCHHCGQLGGYSDCH